MQGKKCIFIDLICIRKYIDQTWNALCLRTFCGAGSAKLRIETTELSRSSILALVEEKNLSEMKRKKRFKKMSTSWSDKLSRDSVLASMLKRLTGNLRSKQRRSDNEK